MFWKLQSHQKRKNNFVCTKSACCSEPLIGVRKITGSPSVRNFKFFLCNPTLVNTVNYYMTETHIYNLSHYQRRQRIHNRLHEAKTFFSFSTYPVF